MSKYIVDGQEVSREEFRSSRSGVGTGYAALKNKPVSSKPSSGESIADVTSSAASKLTEQFLAESEKFKTPEGKIKASELANYRKAYDEYKSKVEALNLVGQGQLASGVGSVSAESLARSTIESATKSISEAEKSNVSVQASVSIPSKEIVEKKPFYTPEQEVAKEAAISSRSYVASKLGFVLPEETVKKGIETREKYRQVIAGAENLPITVISSEETTPRNVIRGTVYSPITTQNVLRESTRKEVFYSSKLGETISSFKQGFNLEKDVYGRDIVSYSPAETFGFVGGAVSKLALLSPLAVEYGGSKVASAVYNYPKAIKVTQSVSKVLSSQGGKVVGGALGGLYVGQRGVEAYESYESGGSQALTRSLLSTTAGLNVFASGTKGFSKGLNRLMEGNVYEVKATSNIVSAVKEGKIISLGETSGKVTIKTSKGKVLDILDVKDVSKFDGVINKVIDISEVKGLKSSASQFEGRITGSTELWGKSRKLLLPSEELSILEKEGKLITGIASLRKGTAGIFKYSPVKESIPRIYVTEGISISSKPRSLFQRTIRHELTHFRQYNKGLLNLGLPKYAIETPAYLSELFPKRLRYAPSLKSQVSSDINIFGSVGSREVDLSKIGDVTFGVGGSNVRFSQQQFNPFNLEVIPSKGVSNLDFSFARKNDQALFYGRSLVSSNNLFSDISFIESVSFASSEGGGYQNLISKSISSNIAKSVSNIPKVELKRVTVLPISKEVLSLKSESIPIVTPKVAVSPKNIKSVEQLENIKVKSIPLISSKEILINKNVVSPVLDIKSISKSKVSSSIKQDIKPSLDILPVQSLNVNAVSDLDIASKIKSVYKVDNIQSKRQLLSPNVAFNTFSIPKTTVPNLPSYGSAKKEIVFPLVASKVKNLYDVFVRVKGKDVLVSSGVSLPIASSSLVGRLKSSLAASGFIAERGSGRRLSFGEFGVGSDFRPSKTDVFRVVQKRSKRLSSRSEVSSIQKARRSSNVFFKKSKAGGFL